MILFYMKLIILQVVAVNDARRRATVKLIPRIDFQALAEKFVSESLLYQLYTLLFSLGAVV